MSPAWLSAALLFAACSSEGDPPGDEAGGSQSGGKGATSATGGTASGASGKGGSSSGVGGAGAGATGSGGTGGTSAAGHAGAGATGTGGVSGASGSGAVGGSGPTGGAGGLGGAGATGAGGATGSSGASGESAGGYAGATAGTSGSGGKAGGAGTAGSGTAGSGTAGAGGGGGSTTSAGCGKTRTLTNGRKTIQSGGNREYIIRVPDNYDNTHPYRLIIAYHWLNGNAQQVANGGMGGSTDDPYYGLWDLAENSTIFVAPEGLNAGWANSGGQDLALTDAILAQVEGDLCIDTTRVFATGFSYGAGMSYAIACARADVFRGVALYAGAQLSGCTGGTKPIAYFHAHGVNDSVLNISQGRQLRDKFVMNNGCTAQNPPEPGGGSGTHTCTSYAGCSAGHPLRWCAHGGDHNPTEKDQGQSKSWIPGEAWEFISQF